RPDGTSKDGHEDAPCWIVRGSKKPSQEQRGSARNTLPTATSSQERRPCGARRYANEGAAFPVTCSRRWDRSSCASSRRGRRRSTLVRRLERGTRSSRH